MFSLKDLRDKDLDVKEYMEKASNDTSLITVLMDGILEKKEKIRRNSLQILLKMSEEQPEILYREYWDFFESCLENENAYVKYAALPIIANLIKVDEENKFESIKGLYYRLLKDKSIMVAGHTAKNLGRVAKNSEQYREEITDLLLEIGEVYPREARRDLLKGYVIEAFEEYYREARNKKKIKNFVEAQAKSESSSTQRRAKDFLERFEKKSLD